MGLSDCRVEALLAWRSPKSRTRRGARSGQLLPRRLPVAAVPSLPTAEV